jgi:hypothetical protein
MSGSAVAAAVLSIGSSLGGDRSVSATPSSGAFESPIASPAPSSVLGDETRFITPIARAGGGGGGDSGAPLTIDTKNYLAHTRGFDLNGDPLDSPPEPIHVRSASLPAMSTAMSKAPKSAKAPKGDKTAATTSMHAKTEDSTFEYVLLSSERALIILSVCVYLCVCVCVVSFLHFDPNEILLPFRPAAAASIASPNLSPAARPADSTLAPHSLSLHEPYHSASSSSLLSDSVDDDDSAALPTLKVSDTCDTWYRQGPPPMPLPIQQPRDAAAATFRPEASDPFGTTMRATP